MSIQPVFDSYLEFVFNIIEANTTARGSSPPAFFERSFGSPLNVGCDPYSIRHRMHTSGSFPSALIQRCSFALQRKPPLKLLVRGFFSACLAGAAMLCCVACNDLPNQVGSGIVTNTQPVQTITSDTSPLFVGTADSVVPKSLPFRMYVGRADGIEAVTFLNFTVPFIPLSYSFPDLTANDITATLVFPATPFLFGDPQFFSSGSDSTRNQYNFRVVELLRSWTDTSTFYTRQDFNAQAAISYGTRTLATLVTKPSPPPVQNAVLRARFDAQTVLRWLRADSAVQKVYGVALLPNPTMRCIREFDNSSTSYPYMEIKIRRPQDTVDAVYTMNSSYHASFVTDATRRDGQTTNFVIQPGAPRRAQIKLNLGGIPARAFINRAELTIAFDSVNSRLSSLGMPDTLFAKLPTLDDARQSALMVNDTVPAAAGVRVAGTNRYVFSQSVGGHNSLAALVERLLQPAYKSNQYVILSISQDREIFNPTSIYDRRERTDIGRIIFYGLNAPPDVRPKLSISYSPRN